MTNTGDTTPIFDLQDAIVVLQEAALLARRLDAVEVPVADERTIRKGDPAVAAANRDIQYLMHLCERAHIEVARIYWANRGYDDPLS